MKLTLLFSLLILAISLGGQSDNKRKFYLSGNTSLTYANNFRNTFEKAAFEAQYLGYFFTEDLMVGVEILAGTDEDLYDGSPYIISPFLRYYLPINGGKPTQFFIEGGIGTIGNFSFGSSFETDFYFGVGAERSFGDGVVGTARLRYKANALELNFTELDLGLNFILGGQRSWDGIAVRQRGAFLVDPTLGSIGFGHRGRSNLRSLDLNLDVGVGYFLTQDLLVETGYSSKTNDVDIGGNGLFNSRTWEAYAGLRYFLPVANRRIQPFLIARAGRAGASFESESSSFGIQSSKRSSSFAEGGIGTLYMLTKQAALDVSFRYQTGLDVSAGSAEMLVASAGLKVFLGK